MQSRVSAALVFERYIWYFCSLHLAFEMSCDTEYLEKNSFRFFRKRGLRGFGLCAIVLMIFVQVFRKILGDFTERKTQSYQNDVEYVPKLSFRALLCFFLWLYAKKNYFEKLLRSLYLGTLRDFHSNAESRFGCARFRRLRLVLWLLTSCVWDVLRYRLLRKKQLLIFSETWSSSFWVVCNCSDDFRPNVPKILGDFTERKTQTFQNDNYYVPNLSVWAQLCFILWL